MSTALDVAKAAGVGKTTVSYVFSPNKRHLISPDTTARVLAAAERLGYHPSYLGRALSMKRSYNVGLVLPLDCSVRMPNHILGIFHGICQSIEKSEYNLNVYFGTGTRLFDRLNSNRLDGLAVVGTGTGNDILNRLAAFNVPLMVINRTYPAAHKVSCVYSDIYGWLNMELERFAGAHCRNILVLNKPENTASGSLMASAIREARKSSPWLRIDSDFIADDITTQSSNLLSSNKYDGYIINGSIGRKFCETAKKMEMEPNRNFKISFPGNDVHDTVHDYVWQRNSRLLGSTGWQLLESIIDGKENVSPKEIPYIRGGSENSSFPDDKTIFQEF